MDRRTALTILMHAALLLGAGSPAIAQLTDREIEAMLGAANEAVWEDDLDTAHRLYTELRTRHGAPIPEAEFNIACIHLAQEEYPDARARLREVLHGTDNPRLLADAHYNLGHVAYSEARLAAADDLAQAIGSLDAAEQAFRRSRVFRPTDTEAARNIEIVQRLRDQYQKQLDQQQEQQQEQDGESEDGQQPEGEQDPGQQDENQEPQEGGQQQPQDQPQEGDQSPGEQQQEPQQSGDQQQPGEQQQSGDQQQQESDQQTEGEQQSGEDAQTEPAEAQPGEPDAQDAADQAREQLRQLIAQILDKERREREARARYRATQRAKTEKDW